jgi:hypothetical protein
MTDFAAAQMRAAKAFKLPRERFSPSADGALGADPASLHTLLRRVYCDPRAAGPHTGSRRPRRFSTNMPAFDATSRCQALLRCTRRKLAYPGVPVRWRTEVSCRGRKARPHALPSRLDAQTDDACARAKPQPWSIRRPGDRCSRRRQVLLICWPAIRRIGLKDIDLKLLGFFVIVSWRSP